MRRFSKKPLPLFDQIYFDNLPPLPEGFEDRLREAREKSENRIIYCEAYPIIGDMYVRYWEIKNDSEGHAMARKWIKRCLAAKLTGRVGY